MSDDSLAQLRQIRDLYRRRDALIRAAAREGYSRQQIALAIGLSRRRVIQILGWRAKREQRSPPTT